MKKFHRYHKNDLGVHRCGIDLSKVVYYYTDTEHGRRFVRMFTSGNEVDYFEANGKDAEVILGILEDM